MSSNAKHYDYYMVEGDDVKKLIDAYDDIKIAAMKFSVTQ